ncbi:MAG: FGGY family carbohydrate kinase, partial [Chloroflexota bacterium]|nr:FGGY family carbohydrate kinase [Chloroflexota bacterium]
MSSFVGLDVGTSGARALAVDETGAVRAEASASYELLTPLPGWTEQRPEDWWRGAQAALRQVVTQVGGDVAAIGLTGQMHGSVFLDREHRVLRPALLWNDQRTERQCVQITEAV